MRKELKYKLFATVVITVMAVVCCTILTVFYNCGIF